MNHPSPIQIYIESIDIGNLKTQTHASRLTLPKLRGRGCGSSLPRLCQRGLCALHDKLSAASEDIAGSDLLVREQTLAD